MFLLARAGSRTKSPDLKTLSSSYLVSRVNKLKKNVKRSIIPVGYRLTQNRDHIKLHNTAWETPTPAFSHWNLARIEILKYFFNSFLSWVVATHSPLFQCVNVSDDELTLKIIFLFQLLQIFSTDFALM